MDKNLNRDLYANFQANIDFTPYLKWTTSYSFGYSTTRNDYFIPSYRNDGNAYATSSSGSVKRWEIENYIQYLRSFKETHNLSVLFGQGAEYSYIDNLWGEGNYIASNSIQTIQGVVSKNSNASSSIEERARLSWFARLSYDYKDKYLFLPTGVWTVLPVSVKITVGDISLRYRQDGLSLKSRSFRKIR